VKRIYKYAIEAISDSVDVRMPNGAEVLHVAAQGGLICLWARVDTERTSRVREFEIRGTGDPLTDDLIYLGTAHIDPFVWHVFERE
jgi:hypothetical protein